MGIHLKAELLNNQETYIRKIFRKIKKFEKQTGIFKYSAVICITNEYINVFVILIDGNKKRLGIVENQIQNRYLAKSKLERFLNKCKINYFDENSIKLNTIIKPNNRFYCSTDYSYVCFEV